MKILFNLQSQTLKPMSNFSGYRDLLAAASAPGVPYLAVVTKDVISIEEMSTYSDEKPDHLNVFKFATLAKVLRPFFRFQNVDYDFEEIPELISEFYNLESSNLIATEDLTVTSLMVEQPEIESPLDSSDSMMTALDSSSSMGLRGSVSEMDLSTSSSDFLSSRSKSGTTRGKSPSRPELIDTPDSPSCSLPFPPH
jgi:hypothetical protein